MPPRPKDADEFDALMARIAEDLTRAGQPSAAETVMRARSEMRDAGYQGGAVQIRPANGPSSPWSGSQDNPTPAWRVTMSWQRSAGSERRATSIARSPRKGTFPHDRRVTFTGAD